LAEALATRTRLSLLALACMGAMLGVVVTRQPGIAAGLTILLLVTLLAFRAPVAHLTILLALTTILPHSIENRYSQGGGGVGLLASDLFVLTGFLRAAFVLPQMRLDRRRLAVVGFVLLFMAFTAFQLFQGLQAGRSISGIGYEFRALASGFGTALIVMTVLGQPGAHRRLMKGLLVLGILLGLWGVAQWVLQVPFSAAEDFGIRKGVSLTSNGRGQIQGGLFAFPVAVILASAALASGRLRRGLERNLVLLALGLNVVSLLLTFERTFWVVTAVGVLLVALRAGRVRRARALMWMAVAASIGLLTLSAVSPGTLRTAGQRLFSIGSYQTDKSVRYRTVESGFVIDKIREHPLLGSGLGDTIYWGQPWTQTKPTAQSYTHVGYLWLTWREGLLGAAILLTLLALAALWPGRAVGGGLVSALRVGCQSSLIALLIANLTFPAFQGTHITYLMGFLVAYSAIPVAARQRVAAPVRAAAPDRAGARRLALG
jgi:hypothetical protein